MAVSIGGMGSGIDSAALISQLMRAEAAPQAKLTAAKSAAAIKAGAWTTLGNLMKTLQDKGDALKTVEKLRLTAAASSDPTAVGVSSTATAAPGSLTFRVDSLATRHQSSTAGFASSSAAVGTGSLVVSTGAAAIGAAVTAGDAGVTGKYTVVISRTSPTDEPAATVDGEVVAFGTDGTARTLSVGGATLTFAGTVHDGTAVLGVAATKATGGTLAELSSALQSTGGPATASLLDVGSGTDPLRMIMTATQSGAKGTLDVAASSGLTGFAGVTTLTAGKDAVLKVGDPASPTTITRSDNRITDLVPGVTLDLLKAAPGTDVTVTVKKDDDAVVTKIKGLTESLNNLLTWVRDNTKYDVASKTGGPMVGDAGVRSIPGTIFSAVATGQPTGEFRLSSHVGLAATRDGTLALDETKLREALTKDPDGVGAVLAGVAAAVAAVGKGAADVGGVVRTGKDSTAARTRALQAGIDGWDLKLAAIQKRYQRQFSALDVAMSRMNSQSSWLAGQINSLPSGR